MASQFQLLSERRFAPLFWTQFLGAANDNLFKFAFTLLATYQAAQWGGGDGATAGFVIGAIFIAPFLIFSATSGQIADKFERAGLMRFVKNLEIVVMAIAAVGFLQKSAPLLYTSVFLMGLHSTIFGPVKYAYLPQHLKDAELTGGNGLVEMGTFVAILLGTMAGGMLVQVGPSGPAYVAAACLAVAVAGRVAAHFIPHSPAPDPALAINWNPFSETWRNLRIAARDKSVFHSLLGISWLWFFGSIFLTAITPFARDVLGGDETLVTWLLALFSIGVGVGALACERLSGRKVEIGLVPFGSIGMTIFAVDLWLASRGVDPSRTRIMADLFLLAMFSGFYSVPLYAVIQARSEPTHRARIIAANNIMNALFMIVAALMSKALLDAGLTLPQLFLVVGLMNAAVAIYIYTLVPEFLMRFICWLLIHTVYRLEKRGLENIPEKGAAVVVANHVSFVDALVILAASPRPIRFVMDHSIFKIPILSFVFRTGKAIPIASAKEDEALLNAAYAEIARALEQGELVGIFPEGRITDTGELYPFRGGIRRIVERTPVPVVPLALKGLWGSYFSRRGGAAMTKPFRRGVWSRIGLEAAPAVAPAAATPEALQEVVQAMRGEWRWGRTMMWIGLVVGVVVGGLVWGKEGAVTLGFIGWLAGVIVKSSQKAQLPAGTVEAPSATPRPSTESWTIEDRVARLEAVVARLEARLGAGVAPVIPDAAPIVVPDAAPAAMVRDAIGSPIVAADAASGMTPEPPTPSEPPAPPPPPRPPNPIVAWFSGVNAIARVGLVILFLGLAFLLKYAAEAQMLPPELRVGGVAVGAIAMLVLGWRLRTRREGFALGLQGAGVAVLYLTTFAALRLYHLIPPELAFFVLAGIAVFSAALAVMQNAVALAVIGAGGGFLAPVLASTGGGSHVMLFSYFLILNLGIVAIAYFRAWRPLNLTGFLFTFLIGLAWGMRSYRPEHFDTTEPFLIAFWVIYVVIAILVARPDIGARPEPDQGQARARPGPGPGFRRYVDGTLVFGVPLAAFGLQAGLMRDTEYGLAFSSLAAAAFYIALAAGLLRAANESWRLLAQSFIALGVVFATLAIPLALDARWTSASWALEGAAIVWIGLRQQRKTARAFGILLQVAAGVAYIHGYTRLPGGYPLVDAAFIGAMLIALAGLWTNRLILGAGEAVTKTERNVATPIFAWGLAWLIFAGADEIRTHLEPRIAFNVLIAFLAATAALFGWLATRWSWSAAAWSARALLPALFALASVMLVYDRHPFGRLGWFAWPFAIAIHAWILRTVDPERRSAYTTFLHAGAMVLVAFVGAQELHWLAQTYTAHHTAWSAAALAVAPALVVWIASMRTFDYRWPIAEHPGAYRLDAPVVIAVALGVWSLVANVTHNASSDPLPYIPILNAVDLAHLFAIFSLASAWLAAKRSDIEPPASLRSNGALVVAAALGFVWLNAILLRTLSHWADIPYTPSALVRSILVQAALSIFWSVLALAAMVYATRTARRPLWMVGVVLLGVVVAKLFLFDLANAGRIEQIVSFIAVGLLILVVGYFSPLPPRKLDPPSPLGEEEAKPEVAS